MKVEIRHYKADKPELDTTILTFLEIEEENEGDVDKLVQHYISKTYLGLMLPMQVDNMIAFGRSYFSDSAPYDFKKLMKASNNGN